MCRNRCGESLLFLCNLSGIRNGHLERLQNNNYDHAHMQSLTLGSLTSVEGTCMDHFLVDFMSTLNPLILQYTIFLI